MSDPDHHAEMEEHVSGKDLLQERDIEIEQLRGKVYLATGFLEGMADRIAHWPLNDEPGDRSLRHDHK